MFALTSGSLAQLRDGVTSRHLLHRWFIWSFGPLTKSAERCAHEAHFLKVLITTEKSTTSTASFLSSPTFLFHPFPSVLVRWLVSDSTHDQALWGPRLRTTHQTSSACVCLPPHTFTPSRLIKWPLTHSLYTTTIGMESALPSHHPRALSPPPRAPRAQSRAPLLPSQPAPPQRQHE